MLKHSPRMAAGTHGTTGQTDHKKARVWAVGSDKETRLPAAPSWTQGESWGQSLSLLIRVSLCSGLPAQAQRAAKIPRGRAWKGSHW